MSREVGCIVLHDTVAVSWSNLSAVGGICDLTTNRIVKDIETI